MNARLHIAGRYAHGDGYPHVTQLLRALRAQPDLEVVDLGAPIGDAPLNATAGAGRKLVLAARLLFGNLVSALRVVASCRRGAVVFMPYPAVPLAFLLSFVPRPWRPRIVVDAFISLWDTAVVDRARFPAESFAARVLFRIERRALATADRVVVDTVENAAYLARTFALDRARIHAMPLASDESVHRAQPYAPAAGAPCRVLFVGTFVPLHGIDVIFDAMRVLRDEPGFAFRLIGDGQRASQLEEALREAPLPDVRWDRRWHSPAEVAQAIAEADVCLGVFGGAGKAARVLPLKLYAYFAGGRAVVTQSRYGTPDGTTLPARFADDAPALASALRELAANPGERARLASDALAFHRDALSMARVVARFREIAGLPPR